MTITQNLKALLSRPISDNDRNQAALLLLDWTGCAVAGQTEAAGQKVTAAFPDEVGHCTRIGASKSSPLMAALHNGCLGNVLEMDDVDRRAVLHAAPTIIPAALAMAEHTCASATDFMNAIVIGYEATIRIGRAVGAGHYAFWHNTATCGPFGAAAAACYLLEGSDLVSAFGLAGTQSAGLWQTRHESDSMAKHLHAGHAAHAGVLAAILSAQGFQGPRSILEGEQGFFRAMCPDANPEDVLKDYGDEWLIHQTSLKPYPACRHAHAAIDAVLAIREQVDWRNTDEIIVETYADAVKFCDRPNPQSSIEAKFSLQHSVAVALVKGKNSLEDFDVDAINQKDIKLTRDKIKVEIDNNIEARYPNNYGAAITVGDIHFETIDAYGDPEYPMNNEAIVQKSVTLMTYAGLTEDKSKRIAMAALGESLTDYTDLLP